jgi:NADPH:quinone reductase
MFARSLRLSTKVVYYQHYSASALRAARDNVKAVVISAFGDASVLQTGYVTVPSPGDRECVIKVHACGVNPVDTYIRSGVYPKLPALPHVLGKDAAGVVDSIGKDVKNVAVGDRVYVFGAISGSYAEYALCSEENTFHLPDNVSFEKGACLGTPAFTAYRALFEKTRGRPGELVFVHGASGGVGLMAVQMACASGMRVVGTSSSAEGMKVSQHI